MFKLFKKKKIEGFYYIEGENTGLPMSWHLLTSRDALKTYNFSSEENAEQYAKIYFPNFVKTQSLHFLKHPLDFINETANGTNPVLADSAIRDALSTLLRVGASMVTTGISGEISEWDLPKTTPLK